MAVGKKKLERRYAEHLASILRPIVREQFENNGTAFARHVGVSQSQMSAILKVGGGDRSVGINVLIRLRDYLNISIDEMLDLPPLRRQSLSTPHAATPPPPAVAVGPVALEDAVRLAINRVLDERFTTPTPPRVDSGPPPRPGSGSGPGRKRS